MISPTLTSLFSSVWSFLAFNDFTVTAAVSQKYILTTVLARLSGRAAGEHSWAFSSWNFINPRGEIRTRAFYPSHSSEHKHTHQEQQLQWLARIRGVRCLAQGHFSCGCWEGRKGETPLSPPPTFVPSIQRPFGTEICPCWPGVDTVSPSGVDKEKKIRAKREWMFSKWISANVAL